MKWYQFYYQQLVSETDLNNAFTEVLNETRTTARDLKNTGVFYGFNVTPTSPVSPNVYVTGGVGRISVDGKLVKITSDSTVDMTNDAGGSPVYSDLGAGEGRWAAVFVRWRENITNSKVDGYGVTIYYDHEDSLEFVVYRATKGNATDKDTLPRPSTIPNAIKLADIWYEAGSVDVVVSDIDFTQREDYFRAFVGSTQISAGNPKDALLQIASFSYDLSNPDLPTGANDGSHKIGLGGTATELEFRWFNGDQLNASGDNVHSAIAKIVTDLASDSKGTELIGSNDVLSTYLGDNIQTNTGSLYSQLEDLLNKINARVKVDGDSRLNGDFIPLNDNSINIGDNTHNLSSVYTKLVRSSDNLTVVGNNHLGLIGDMVNLQGSYDVGIASNNSNISLEVVASKTISLLSGSNSFNITDNSLYPSTDEIQDLGKLTTKFNAVHTKRVKTHLNTLELQGDNGVSVYPTSGIEHWVFESGRLRPSTNGTLDLGQNGGYELNNIYLSGDINISPAKTMTKTLSIGDVAFDGDYFAWNSYIAPYYLRNTSYTHSLIIPLSFLKVGDRLNSVQLDVLPSSDGGMEASVYRQTYGANRYVISTPIASSGTGRQTLTLTVNADIFANNSYYVILTFKNSNGHRYYGASVSYNIKTVY